MNAALNIERIFQVSATRLFNAWTDPQIVNSWFGPEGFIVIESSMDTTVGGQYRIVIQSPDGKEISHYGEYVEYQPPISLAFTWVLENQDCAGGKDQFVTTLVSLSFEAISTTQTKLLLTHEQLPNEEAYNGHEFGWQSSLNSLQAFLTSG